MPSAQASAPTSPSSANVARDRADVAAGTGRDDYRSPSAPVNETHPH